MRDYHCETQNSPSSLDVKLGAWGGGGGNKLPPTTNFPSVTDFATRGNKDSRGHYRGD